MATADPATLAQTLESWCGSWVGAATALEAGRLGLGSGWQRELEPLD